MRGLEGWGLRGWVGAVALWGQGGLASLGGGWRCFGGSAARLTRAHRPPTRPRLQSYGFRAGFSLEELEMLQEQVGGGG